jgi:hypothetical protein
VEVKTGIKVLDIVSGRDNPNCHRIGSVADSPFYYTPQLPTGAVITKCEVSSFNNHNDERIQTMTAQGSGINDSTS